MPLTIGNTAITRPEHLTTFALRFLKNGRSQYPTLTKTCTNETFYSFKVHFLSLFGPQFYSLKKPNDPVGPIPCLPTSNSNGFPLRNTCLIFRLSAGDFVDI